MGAEMKNELLKHITSIYIIVFFFFASCSDSPTDPEKNMIDSGSWYETGFTPWPHDGNPYESEHFIVYSDAASLEARQLLSQICEEAFALIIDKLGIIDLSIFQFPPNRNNKIHIYAYKNYNPMSWGGQAYYGGYIIYSPDHQVRTEWGQTALENYVPLVRHEMMHVIQTLILGNNDESYLYSWFAEGIAIENSDDVFYSEDAFYAKIDNQVEFDNLISTYGQRNPVAIRHSWDMPNDIEAIGKLYYYPMYWLALRYIIDPEGPGGSFHDVREVLLDGTRGLTFNTSLNKRFGISQSEFENQFFNLMNDYLD
jgi:hypothetical protein